jgi:hypothetical protein
MKPSNTIILRALKRGEHLTPQTCLSRYCIFSLAQRVSELRLKHGQPILSKRVPGQSYNVYSWMG